jgi:hypothetical protein
MGQQLGSNRAIQVFRQKTLKRPNRMKSMGFKCWGGPKGVAKTRQNDDFARFGASFGGYFWILGLFLAIYFSTNIKNN